jgi:putative addiction module CopG family antidote
MEIRMTADEVRFLRRKVATGRYDTEAEVVHEALCLLEANEATQDAKLARLRNAVAAGIADADAGRFVDSSPEPVLDRARQRIREQEA